jgi:hypothetical protein
VKLDDARLRGEARQPQRHIFEHLPSDAGNERPLGGLREVFLRFRLINEPGKKLGGSRAVPVDSHEKKMEGANGFERRLPDADREVTVATSGEENVASPHQSGSLRP